MTLNFSDPIVLFWLLINTTAAFVTAQAVYGAWLDYRTARGTQTGFWGARLLTARGNVRRESLRLITQLLLLSLAVPALFRTTPVTLSPSIVVLMLVPVVLFIATAFDARDRAILTQMLLVPGTLTDAALESSIQENIALTRDVGEKAEAAYHEANSVNEKLVRLHELIEGKEDKESP